MSGWFCRVCGIEFPHSQRSAFLSHVSRCVERNADVIDGLRPKAMRPGEPFEGDPEALAFAMAEGDVYNRRPGTRKRPR
jgi:hypothetical protein